jgi:hypothetical protein
LARNVGACGTFRRCATHDHVFNFASFYACALNRVLNGMTTQGGTMRHVESAFPAFGQRRACGRNNDGVGHIEYL